MKKIVLLITFLAISLCMPMTALAAEWKWDDRGMMFLKDDGTFAKNEWIWNEGPIYFDYNDVLECYYFDGDGLLLRGGTTPDGNKVDHYGRWLGDNNMVKTKLNIKDLDRSNATNAPQRIPILLGTTLEEAKSIFSSNGIPVNVSDDGTRYSYFDLYGINHFYDFDNGICNRLGADAYWLTEKGAIACQEFYLDNTSHKARALITLKDSNKYDAWHHYVNGDEHEVIVTRDKSQQKYHTQYSEGYYNP